ncbi:UPF0489 family protein [Paraburkholderia humisilvae]|uniref:Uncharacterized protein n=1 Tax=Paraburkholderia humisilvae TaxID=627669 RepID=A0A6J5F8G4_9BURK|nr:hypothetical protein LMG29542_07506 [Paraburkholderia humisilvae]
MHEVDFSQLQPDDEYVFDLGSDVLLMDDHRWASLVWTRSGFEREIGPFSLVHADYHWDGVNDFHENEDARERLLTADLMEIEAMVRNKDRIQYDSFIAPAVIRKLVTEVHFPGKQTSTGPGLGDRLRLWGPGGAHDEFLMAATVRNLRRMARTLMSGSKQMNHAVA